MPGLTQKAVADGEDFEYRFVAPDAGTFWYHSHSRSWEQVARGLYGPLVVEETTPPDVDADIIVVIDDWRLGENAEFIDDFDGMFHFAHGGRLGNYAKAIVWVTVPTSSTCLSGIPSSATSLPSIPLISTGKTRAFAVLINLSRTRSPRLTED